MYVLKKSSKFWKKSQQNFSKVKILVYVRAEKIDKISEKISTEFLAGQNSHICTCGNCKFLPGSYRSMDPSPVSGLIPQQDAGALK